MNDAESIEAIVFCSACVPICFIQVQDFSTWDSWSLRPHDELSKRKVSHSPKERRTACLFVSF